MAKVCTVVNTDYFLTLNPTLWSFLVTCPSIGALYDSDWVTSSVPFKIRSIPQMKHPARVLQSAYRRSCDQKGPKNRIQRQKIVSVDHRTYFGHFCEISTLSHTFPSPVGGTHTHRRGSYGKYGPINRVQRPKSPRKGHFLPFPRFSLETCQ